MDNKNTKNTLGSDIYIYIESRDSLGFFFFNARIDYLIVHLK